MKNNTGLTPLEIEQVREAIKGYAEDYFSPVRYIVIDEISAREDGYDFTVDCALHFRGDREEDHVLGVNRIRDGFTILLN